MRRILLILEDYNEQVFLETFLKKIGFDVLPVRNEMMLADQMLIFKPDIIISTGDGNKIKGPNILKKMTKNRGTIKLILLFPMNKLHDETYMSQFKADVAVETPINPRLLIGTICAVSHLNPEPILAKFEKLPIATGNSGTKKEDIKIISSRDEKKIFVKDAMPDRKSKYAQILKESADYEDLGFARSKVNEEIKKNREYEKENPELEKLEEDRKKFVLALFKK